MQKIQSYRLRKCSDVNMGDAYFEVLDDSDTIIFDISKGDNDELSILFYDGVASKCMPVAMLATIVEDVRSKFKDG